MGAVMTNDYLLILAESAPVDDLAMQQLRDACHDTGRENLLDLANAFITLGLTDPSIQTLRLASYGFIFGFIDGNTDNPDRHWVILCSDKHQDLEGILARATGENSFLELKILAGLVGRRHEYHPVSQFHDFVRITPPKERAA